MTDKPRIIFDGQRAMTEHTQVPVTWIVCGHNQTDSRKFDRRLHAIGDELHEQKTEITQGRYHWALHPKGTVIRCQDSATGNVVEFDIEDGDRWLVEWLREAMKLVRRKMT
jgi:hypothetical protein